MKAGDIRNATLIFALPLTMTEPSTTPMTNLTTIAANRTVDLWWRGPSHAARWRD